MGPDCGRKSRSGYGNSVDFPRDDQSALGNPWKRWSMCYNGRHSLLTSAVSCSEAVLRKHSILEENKVFPIEVYYRKSTWGVKTVQEWKSAWMKTTYTGVEK
jgi:hypothetical protein